MLSIYLIISKKKLLRILIYTLMFPFIFKNYTYPSRKSKQVLTPEETHHGPFHGPQETSRIPADQTFQMK